MPKKSALPTNDAVSNALDDGKTIDAAYRRAVRKAVAANPKTRSATVAKKRAKVRAA